LVQALEGQTVAALAESQASRIVLGLSGGPDSLALAAALAWATQRRDGPLAGLPAQAHVVDHGLQAGSAEVAAEAVRQAAQLGLETRLSRVTVTRSGAGPEADARRARLAVLLDQPEAVVLLGHTLDDQAETVLLGLARGSGPRSLAGMAARQGRLVRPWLGHRRSETERACRDWGLRPWRDPTNQDPRYARSRLRQGLAGLESYLGPGLAEALARTAQICAQDADLLERLADRELARRLAQVDPGASAPVSPAPAGSAPAGSAPAGLPLAGLSDLQPAAGQSVCPPHREPPAGDTKGEEPTRLPLAGLSDLHPALLSRVLLAWLRRSGGQDLQASQIDAVARLVTDWHGQSHIALSGGQVRRRGDVLEFHPQPAPTG
jgi:tRNA(Ile)-lysidine synthase